MLSAKTNGSNFKKGKRRFFVKKVYVMALALLVTSYGIKRAAHQHHADLGGSCLAFISSGVPSPSHHLP